jgi:hypothetical protein
LAEVPVETVDFRSEGDRLLLLADAEGLKEAKRVLAVS